MKVDLTALREGIARLIDHAIEMNGESVDVQDDIYWFVQKSALHDATKPPTDLTLGSLADDWVELEAIGRKEKEPHGYAFVWAAAVLRAIGDRTY